MTERAEGRILRSLSGFYDVQTADGLVTCRARGILRKEGNSPLTGDLVEITVERGKGMVEKILPRKNKFIRPAVANIDALVVFAANVNPITEPYLIDRVAAIAGDQNVPVILCINKSHRSTLFLLKIILAVWVNEVTPSKCTVVKRGYKHLCRCNIGGKRNVINVAKTEQV